jgi:glycine betaine/proline transport system substrate-binding protein
MSNHLRGADIILIRIWLLILISSNLTWATEQTYRGKVLLTYVEWSSEIASANVVKVVLEQLGYEVEIIPITAVAMWQAVASGEADALVAAWLYTAHAHYLRAVRHKVEYLGPNLEGTKIGLVVPHYVTINSIEELNTYANKFGKKIIGIDPGVGLMSKTAAAITTYHLKFELLEGSGVIMTEQLEQAIANQQWVVVTGWTPHWMFSRWQLKYLADPKGVYDPKGIYSGEEHIGTIVRKGLKQDLPEVYRVLDKFYWEPADMEQVMIWNEENNLDPYKNAQRWVKANPNKVNCWISPSPNQDCSHLKEKTLINPQH